MPNHLQSASDQLAAARGNGGGGGDNQQQPRFLSATYVSKAGNDPFSLVRLVDPLAATAGTAATPAQKQSVFLHSLRAVALIVQDQVNKELTARMEQDALRAQKHADDDQEEENYGEEVQEDGG